MERDIAEWDFRHARLTRLVLERDYAELGLVAVHTRAANDWWDLVVTFPAAAYVELEAGHAEFPLLVEAADVKDALNEPFPNQRILDLVGISWTGFHLRVRFDRVEMVAEKRVPGPGWSENELPEAATVLAELTFGASPEGRHSAIFSGYRPDWWIGHHHDGNKALNGGEVFLLEREFVFPGETMRIAIAPTSPEYWTHIGEGSAIEMCEGSRVTGVARVIRVRS